MCFLKFTQPVESARIGKGQRDNSSSSWFYGRVRARGEDKQQFSCSGAEGDPLEGLQEELWGHCTNPGMALLQGHPTNRSCRGNLDEFGVPQGLEGWPGED